MLKAIGTKNKHLKKCCTQEYWITTPKRWFPILTWLPNYSFEDFKGDFIAGLSVGLTVVPQGLALSQLAELPPQYGLYTAFMGSFMYAIFGTCKDLVIGPTSVMALMTAEHALNGGPDYAVMLSFLCGCIQLLLGVLNLGFVVNFISASVLSGFTTAAAIIIATSQLKGFLGLKFQSRGFLENIYKVILNIKDVNFFDLSMGILSVAFLLFLKQYKDKKCSGCIQTSRFQHFVHGLWWSVATARNLLVVLACSIIAALFLSSGKSDFTLTQHVDAGLPGFSLPPFSIPYIDMDANVTAYRTTLHILEDLGSGAIIIPLLSLLEAIAIAKVFSKNKSLDATREMIAVGMGNLMGSFVSAYPVTGSFSRTVINNSTGVRTPLGGIFSGMLVLLALGLIAPSFHYIPRACLSAIIFSAVIFMIHFEDIPAMWNTSKLDLIPFGVTFILSLTLGLEYGLLFGVAISLAMLLYRQNKPKMVVRLDQVENQKVIIHITPDNCIYFPAIESLKGKITKALSRTGNMKERKIVINGDRLTKMDYATAMGLKSMAASLEKDNIEFEIDVSEPKAMDALKCLEGSVQLNNHSNELRNISTGGTSQKEIQDDILENDSSTALLDPTTAVQYSNNTATVHHSEKSEEVKGQCIVEYCKL